MEDANLQTDVKTIGIVAIGDICLMAEIAFQPYFSKTMETLILAGQASINEIDPNMPVEDQKNIQELRQALVEAFMSIINGIKSPISTNDYQNQF